MWQVLGKQQALESNSCRSVSCRSYHSLGNCHGSVSYLTFSGWDDGSHRAVSSPHFLNSFPHVLGQEHVELCGQGSQLLCFSHVANMQPMRGRREYLSILTGACWSLLSRASYPACLPDLCLLALSTSFSAPDIGEGFLGLLYQLLPWY